MESLKHLQILKGLYISPVLWALSKLRFLWCSSVGNFHNQTICFCVLPGVFPVKWKDSGSDLKLIRRRCWESINYVNIIPKKLTNVFRAMFSSAADCSTSVQNEASSFVQTTVSLFELSFWFMPQMVCSHSVSSFKWQRSYRVIVDVEQRLSGF